jgi:hypothetical protein
MSTPSSNGSKTIRQIYVCANPYRVAQVWTRHEVMRSVPQVNFVLWREVRARPVENNKQTAFRDECEALVGGDHAARRRAKRSEAASHSRSYSKAAL